MDLLSAFTLSLGLGINSDIQTSDVFSTKGRAGYHLKLEHDPSDFSLWGSYYNKEHYAVGQPIFKSGTWVAGLGYDIDVSDKVEINLGLGVAGFTNANVQQVSSNGPDTVFPEGVAIVGEAAFTYLVGRHNVEGRPIPIPPEQYENYNQDYGSGWKHRSPEFFGRIGLSYNLSSQWEVAAQFNIFNPKSTMWISKTEIAQDIIDYGLKAPNFNPCQYESGCGFWVEDRTWGMNSFELTLSYQW
jgi:hypothetical protein